MELFFAVVILAVCARIAFKWERTKEASAAHFEDRERRRQAERDAWLLEEGRKEGRREAATKSRAP